ncbi:MAG: hypothetical protein GY929_27570, partial [Actinomycetia bacterium]|nr:hypothetical protein [Actinomycetes bacterium]
MAASFIVASCGGGAPEEQASGPQFIHSEASTWANTEGDGFNHLVIDLTALDLPEPTTPDSSPPMTTTTTAHEPGEPSESAGTDPGSSPRPTATTILPIGSDASVHVYSEPDGSLWALLENGDRVPVALDREGLILALVPEEEPAREGGGEGGNDGGSPFQETTTTTSPPPPPAEPDIVLELRADPDVESIVALGNGTWSAITSLTVAQLETRTGQPVRSDALLGLATDDRHYSEQWALENTGSEGIAGADIDIEGARAVTDGEGV